MSGLFDREWESFLMAGIIGGLLAGFGFTGLELPVVVSAGTLVRDTLIAASGMILGLMIAGIQRLTETTFDALLYSLVLSLGVGWCSTLVVAEVSVLSDITGLLLRVSVNSTIFALNVLLPLVLDWEGRGAMFLGGMVVLGAVLPWQLWSSLVRSSRSYLVGLETSLQALVWLGFPAAGLGLIPESRRNGLVLGGGYGLLISGLTTLTFAPEFYASLSGTTAVIVLGLVSIVVLFTLLAVFSSYVSQRLHLQE